MIRDQLADALRTALDTLEVDPLPDEIHLERPARREHGDWSSNVALATAKKAGRNPRELAMQLAETLNAAPPPHVLSVEVAGPGFVNFRLADSWLHDVLDEVVDQGVERYARLDTGAGTRVMVEFVQRQPDRSAARRPRPGSGLRRLAGPGARPVRLRRRPGVLPQRPRHADGDVRRAR